MDLQAYAVESEELSKYDGLFTKYDADRDGFVTHQEASAVFQHSGVAPEGVSRVWALADLDHDGRLSRREFAVAMRLLICASKRGLPIPASVPPPLLQSIDTLHQRGQPQAMPPTQASLPQAAPPRLQPPPSSAPGLAPLGSLSSFSGSIAAGPTLPPQPLAAARAASPSVLMPHPQGLASPPAAAPQSQPTTVIPLLRPPSLGSMPGLPRANSHIMGLASPPPRAGPERSAELGELSQRLRTEGSALNSTVQQAQEEQQQAERELGNSLEGCGRLLAELEGLWRQQRERHQAIDSQRTRLAEASAQRQLLQLEVEHAQQIVQDVQDRGASLVRICNAGDVDVLGLKDLCEASRQEEQALRTQVSGLSQRKDACLQSIQALEREFEATRAQLAAIKQQRIGQGPLTFGHC